jgi:hypothetical protein
VADRAVLGAQPGGGFDQRFAARQARKDILDDRLIDVEFADGAADVFFGEVAEQLQLRLVGVQDAAVRPDQVESDRRVLEKIFQVQR